MNYYRIIRANDHEDLEKKVNLYLIDGWNLHGPMIITSNNVISEVRFYQVLIRGLS